MSASNFLVATTERLTPAHFINDLRQKLSKETVFLTAVDLGFSSALQRWTDIDRKTPGVVAQPASEDDVALLVSRFPHTAAG